MARAFRGTKGSDDFIQNSLTAINLKTLGGNDTIDLNRSDDLGGDNRVDAGAGKDTVRNAFEGGNTILLGKGDDLYIGTGFSSLGGFDVVAGGAGNDQFVIQTFGSVYQGGNGKDVFVSDGWQNSFNGGNGIDTISYQFRHQNTVIGDEGVTVDLAAGKAQTGASRFETLVSIENTIGSENSDRIGGTDGDNTLVGLGGRDEITGFGGNDVIQGGGGEDLLSGGLGADRFVYTDFGDSASGGFDIITDFSSLDGDKIDLSGMPGSDSFVFLGESGFTGDGGEIRFIAGFIFVDTDGNRNADLIIDMNGLASMSNTDFLV